MRVKLKGITYATPTTGTRYVRKIGLLEPLGLSVGYLDQLMTMYTHGRIVASNIKITVVNLANEPIRAALGIAPHDWTLSHDDLILRKHSRNTVISSKGGLDKWTTTSAVTSTQVLGKQYVLADFDFDLLQAKSSTPLDSNEPIWLLNLEATGAVINASINVLVEYDFEFYCLQPST